MNTPLRYKPQEEIDALLEQVDNLYAFLGDAQRAETYEELTEYLSNAYGEAEDICTDISRVQELSSNKNFNRKEFLRPNEIDNEEEDEDEDDEYQQNFVNALNNFIKAHR